MNHTNFSVRDGPSPVRGGTTPSHLHIIEVDPRNGPRATPAGGGGDRSSCLLCSVTLLEFHNPTGPRRQPFQQTNEKASHMKYFSVTDLIARNQDLRKLVSAISVASTTIRNEADKIREEVEKTFADVRMPKQDKINAVNRAVRDRVDEFAEPLRDDVNAKLREMEGVRLELEEGRELMTNPIRFLSAVTSMDAKLVDRRVAAQRLAEGAGPRELETMLAVAKSANDVGMIGAIVAANDRLPTKSRPFTNASAVDGVELPGFADVQAVYAEVESLPQFAVHASRALDRGGQVKGADRIARGLAQHQVETNPDGSLASLSKS